MQDIDLHKLSDQFDREMMNVYNSALKKCNYKASRFLQMFLEYKGVTTAKMLLSKRDVQYGFTELYLCGCLGLSMEVLVLKPEYKALFTTDELQEAKRRLVDVEYLKA